MEQGVAPAAWDLAIPAPGRLGWPSGPTTRVCLQWLDGERNDGGGSRMATVGYAHRSLPGRRLRGEKPPQVERREACVLRKARGAFAKEPNVAQRLSALRSLTR